jgi:hypothetical protein
VLASGAPVTAGFFYEKNLGGIFDDIGVMVGHRTEIRFRITKDELANGPPGAGGGAHALIKVTYEIDGMDKTRPFGFEGFVFAPTWASDAWLADFTDPPGNGLLTLTANTAKYGDKYWLKAEDDFLEFSFHFYAPIDFPGYPVQGFFKANDPTLPNYGQVTEEDSFHPFSTVPEPSSLALLGAGTMTLLVYRWRRGKRAG